MAKTAPVSATNGLISLSFPNYLHCGIFFFQPNRPKKCKHLLHMCKTHLIIMGCTWDVLTSLHLQHHMGMIMKGLIYDYGGAELFSICWRKSAQTWQMLLKNHLLGVYNFLSKCCLPNKSPIKCSFFLGKISFSCCFSKPVVDKWRQTSRRQISTTYKINFENNVITPEFCLLVCLLIFCHEPDNSIVTFLKNAAVSSWWDHRLTFSYDILHLIAASWHLSSIQENICCDVNV